MAFKKQGTPQPMKIATGMCEVCGRKPAVELVNGKMVCLDCKEKSNSTSD